MIGKTALALAAAAFIASSVALLVGAAGFALYLALQPLLIPAGAAACVAGAALIVLLMTIGIARLQHLSKHEPKAAIVTATHPMIDTFSAALKQRPLLIIGLAGLTGLAATRNPDLLRSIMGAIVPPRAVGHLHS